MSHGLMEPTGEATSTYSIQELSSSLSETPGDIGQETCFKGRRIIRMSNVKKRRSEDDGYTSDSSLIFYRGPNHPHPLPQKLEVPVKLSNFSLSESKIDTMGQSRSKPDRIASKRSSSEENGTPQNNNNVTRPTIIIQDAMTGKEIEATSNDLQETTESPAESESSNLNSEEIVNARYKRSFVLQELLETEQNYVLDLDIIVHSYMEEIKNIDLPEGLKGKEKIVFGNIRAILAFHRDKFLPGVQQFHDNPQELGALFTKYEKQLRLYITYCENKPRSEYIVTEFMSTFRKLSQQVNRKFQIQDLLIKPIQRIMKYQLLLKDILKYTERAHEPVISLHKAMDVMHAVPQAANNMMEVGRIDGFEVKLAVHGTILLQDTLHVAEFKIKKSEDRKYKLRRVFLFEQIFLICDLCESPTMGHYYKHRNSIKVSELRLVETVHQEPFSFVLSSTRNANIDMYIQTRTAEVKEEWTRAIQDILDKQTDFLQILQNPLSSMHLGPEGSSTRVSRTQSDRQDASAENHKHKHKRHRDGNTRHRTIH